MVAGKRPPGKRMGYRINVRRRLLPTTMRALRLVLVLHCAGQRGILLRDLIDSLDSSRATTFRDLDRLRDAGWRVLVRMERIDGIAYAVYSLATAQNVPKLAGGKVTKPRRVN